MLALACGALAAAACTGHPSGPTVGDRLAITAPSLAGGEFRTVNTCQGGDAIPELRFHRVPPGTRALALTMLDVDDPRPQGNGTFVHWVLYDVGASCPGLGAAAAGDDPSCRGRAGTNDWGRTAYGGPCPERGRHRYVFTLYALDSVLGDRGALGRADLVRALQGRVIAEASVTATYERRARVVARARRAVGL